MQTTTDTRGSEGRNRVFATTCWTVVLSARESGAPDHQAALEELCRNYWYPLYAYARRRGWSHEDAEDVIQGFFAQLLDRRSLLKVSPDKGRFRSFLLASLNFFMSDARDREKARKRGGGCEVLSFDAVDADHRYQLEPRSGQTPERFFERRWALAILDQVFKLLEAEYARAGKAELYRALLPFLSGERSHGTYADAAKRLNSSEAAIKMAVLRLRQKYRELFRGVIAQTVESPADIETEFSDLMAALSSST